MNVSAGEITQSYYVAPENKQVSNIHEPVSLILDAEGNIIDCSESGERLFGFQLRELKSRHISLLFPLLSGVELIKNDHLNPFLHYLCHCGAGFQTRTHACTTFDSELHFVELIRHGQMCTIRLVVLPFVEAE